MSGKLSQSPAWLLIAAGEIDSCMLVCVLWLHNEALLTELCGVGCEHVHGLFTGL